MIMDIEAYLKRLKESSSDSEREENVGVTTKGTEEITTIPRCLQSIFKFRKDKLKVSKLTTNVHKPKDKI